MIVAVTTAFAMGWALNHDANRQKSKCRKMARGWGIVRYANYVGSLLYTWASCAACRAGHLFPYTEALLVTATVVHRCFHDEARCKEKYGDTWDEYCKIVKWRMIPGVF
ncbi:hypothetical protein BN1723_013211 [Verticillium longisporum]|uniref:7-dehydrocholesterol reductase n=1 Tax=Verticillium longisporum TaxID=100787 RepID=A0A0G4LQC2_VERLO|nr:hypothetical protein BN1723_013211 [Verticillium longisporum]